ncbi:Bug family tripartite tricarboxylate transporter substrate binding protein [Chloroflexota bacterium]
MKEKGRLSLVSLLIVCLLVVPAVLGCTPETTTPKPTTTPTPTPTPTSTPTEDVAAFYKDKVIEFIVTYTPGGGYDFYARVIAPYFEKYTGATVVVKNMPGGGGITALNHVYNNTKPDGRTIVIGPMGVTMLYQALDYEGAKYDVTEMGWLSRVSVDPCIFCTAKDGNYTTMDKIRDSIGFKWACIDRGSLAGYRQLPPTLAFNMQDEIWVYGYPGSAEETLSVLQGETDGVALSVGTIIKLIKSGDFIPHCAVANEREAQLPDVPTIYEAIPDMSAEAKKWTDWWISYEEIGRPLLTGPGVPEARVEFLRNALEQCLTDEDLIAQAEQAGYNIKWLSGEKMSELAVAAMNISDEDKQQLAKYFE